MVLRVTLSAPMFLPPIKIEGNPETEAKDLNRSRERYTSKKDDVEEKIRRWSGMLSSEEREALVRKDIALARPKEAQRPVSVVPVKEKIVSDSARTLPVSHRAIGKETIKFIPATAPVPKTVPIQTPMPTSIVTKIHDARQYSKDQASAILQPLIQSVVPSERPLPLGRLWLLRNLCLPLLWMILKRKSGRTVSRRCVTIDQQRMSYR